MRAVKHTSGPWMFVRNAVTHSYRIENEYHTVARIVGTGPTPDANAKLIAAAPDMAEALLKVRTDMLRDDFDSENDRCEYVLNYVRAALAKAGL